MQECVAGQGRFRSSGPAHSVPAHSPVTKRGLTRVRPACDRIASDCQITQVCEPCQRARQDGLSPPPVIADSGWQLRSAEFPAQFEERQRRYPLADDQLVLDADAFVGTLPMHAAACALFARGRRLALRDFRSLTTLAEAGAPLRLLLGAPAETHEAMVQTVAAAEELALPMIAAPADAAALAQWRQAGCRFASVAAAAIEAPVLSAWLPGRLLRPL